MKVVVILPTYNERDTIIALLTQAREVLKDIHHHTISYLVVDDSSPDGTAELVKEFQKKHKDVYLSVGKKEGLGSALRRGMTYAVETLKADCIVQMDADLSHDPRNLIEFIGAIDNGYDFAVGSRYIPGGSIPANWGTHRKIYSVVGNSFVRFGLGFPRIHDWTGGYRAFLKKYYDIAHHKVAAYTGYVFQIAFLHTAVRAGATVYEVPIHFTDRRYGHSKIAAGEYIKNVISYVTGDLIHRLRYGRAKKFAMVGIVGFIVNTIVLELMVHGVGTDPWIGSAIGAEFAIISNFILNNGWTFKDKKITSEKYVQKFIQFNLASIGAILIQALTVYIGSHTLGEAHYRLYYVMGVGFGILWNYTLYTQVIWKK